MVDIVGSKVPIENDPLALLMVEIRDIKENHLTSIYLRLGVLEVGMGELRSDAKWTVRLLSASLLVGLAVVGGIFTLVAKAI